MWLGQPRGWQQLRQIYCGIRSIDGLSGLSEVDTRVIRIIRNRPEPRGIIPFLTLSSPRVATCLTYYFLCVGNRPLSHAHATFRLATLLHAYVICLGFSHIRMHVGERGPLELSLWILSCLGAPLTVVDSYILTFGSSLA